MSDSAKLERRYRRLLHLYPRAFRLEHEQEMVPVLMDGAAPDQRRPKLADAADLAKGATWVRLRNPTAWEEQHFPAFWVVARFLIGVWLVVLTAILCHYGMWWGLALLPFAALHFYIAVRLARFTERQGRDGASSRKVDAG